jgi:hypothetical protein
MYGKIIRIDEVYGYKLSKKEYSTYEGYEIITENNKILVLIQDGQQCCERSGYFSSDDDLSEFIGANLREINLTDTALERIEIKEKEKLEDSQCSIQFVDFVTSKGTFQLAVYNSHNGYYGHDIMVRVDDSVICKETL